ncbi:hypothetical protein KC19_11G136600 [Ceratodon purpureus]|uniref:Protein kinase domain-containing protein n=1 Tax=Ceratodon purpureus TaxID=3225 RepID=A0A8T0GER8_CERPU|nr:hypothetical protein KC19_11G136600 [Ceratodon purpureus]KAG0557515.1 hypothetical protein KC19_11G136600 [Ceratodon purpureus]
MAGHERSVFCSIPEHGTSSMGHVLGGKGWNLMLQRKSCFCAIVVALLFLSPPTTEAIDYTTYWPPEQLDALQSLWAAWNRSTPNPGSNLAGWNSSQTLPCWQEYDQFAPNWRGVQCLDAKMDCTAPDSTNKSDCNGYIIGLTLNNASIHGVLPPEIGNITTLATLELTGNPNLTGPLPYEINYPYLYTLDLHDNGFNGTLPDMPQLYTLLNVDLSGNQFVGRFLPQIHKWAYLQILKLARNHFNDTIPRDAFVNMTQMESLDLSVNKLTGAVPDLTKCTNLQSLVLSNNSFSGPLPDLTTFTSLRTLKLAYNNLTGSFPFLSSFVNASTVNGTLSVLDLSGTQLTGSVTNWNASDMISLEELYLDNNRISGTLDVSHLIASGFVRNVSATGSQGLRTLSMMNTDITDVIYEEGSIGGIKTLVRLQGTPYCNSKTADDGTRCFCQQFCSNQGSLNNTKVIIIAAVTSSIAILLMVIAFAAAYLYRTRRYKRYLLLQVQQKFEEFDVKPTIFPYNELRLATRDFHPDMKLGEGGYGAVYKGVLPSKSTVAVKQLFVKNTQGIDDFLNEVVLITGMKHRNLVNLKGCCLREHQRLLVYEYVDNYDIDQVLLRGEHKTPLSWAVRQNICLGVARGLHYLHSLAKPRIIHRDIKASNILLDKSFEPKIADFGLALLFPDEKSHIMTVHVAGTKGYLAPEYASLGQLSEKVDVFSFGVLCLEVLSGRRNIEESVPLDEVYLSKWAWKLHAEGKLMDLVDPIMNLQDDEKADVQRLFNIALLCSQDSAEERPTMARVVAMLQHDTESEVVVLNSGKRERQLDSVRLLAFGKGELPTVTETEDEAETSTLNPRASRRESVRRDGELITVDGLIQLSEMRAR